MRLQLSRLWYHPDFMRLWAGQTISVLGSMVGFFALNLTAILFLNATPLQMGLLGVARLIPGFIISLLVGARVDRMHRRPILIAADLGRAVILATIPFTALLNMLHIEQLYIVVFLISILTMLFNVAYESYLPSLVPREDLIECNSKLSASASLSEIGGFSIAGWLVQVFTVSFGILIDAMSFVFSALFIAFISSKEEVIPATSRQGIRSEIGAGLKEVWQNPFLKASAICTMILELFGGINGVLVVLYMTRGLGFQPKILGMIWAVGGTSSLFAAIMAARVNKRFGIGSTMVLCLLVAGISMIFIPLAKGATLPAALLLIASQLFGDGAIMLYGINKVSLHQSIAPRGMIGRVNASIQFIGIGATLTGSLLGGFLGEMVGVRSTLFIGACGTLLSMFWLVCSPIRRLRVIPGSTLTTAAS